MLSPRNVGQQGLAVAGVFTILSDSAAVRFCQAPSQRRHVEHKRAVDSAALDAVRTNARYTNEVRPSPVMFRMRG